MKKLRLILLLFFLSVSAFSYTDEKILIVGSEQNYPPFALGLTDETADGFTVELWKAVAAETHLNSTIHVLPFHEVLEEFKAKKIDVLINLAQSDERREFVDFTVPHVIVHGAIFVRDDDDKIHSEADLNDKKIIVLNADLAHDYAVSKGWEKQLILVDTAEEGFKLLASGQDDALLLGKLTGKQTLTKLNITDIDVLPIKVNFSQKFSFAVQKGNSELLAKINEGLALTKASGVYDKLYEKWFGIYEEKELLPLLLKYLTPIIGLFLLVLMGIFHRRNVERKKIINILKEKEQRLALSNADLLQFTHISAHHLQEPTRRIVSFVQRLKNVLQNLPTCNDDDVIMTLQFIEQSALRQRALVSDIQLYLAATQPRAAIESVNVADILTKVLKHHAPVIQKIKAQIEYDELPALVIDRPRLYDIFNILLDNALHYCRPDCIPKIRIYGELKNGRVFYYIEDNGIGIPVEYRERVFLVFERLQVDRNQESTGIGLAIVRRIIESCGGTIYLTETAGGGTTVVFNLPAEIELTLF
jgi:ABC-type amino acid transport substrate-binding protein/nitrogen-specific signal transduction histidine kinase